MYQTSKITRSMLAVIAICLPLGALYSIDYEYLLSKSLLGESPSMLRKSWLYLINSDYEEGFHSLFKKFRTNPKTHLQLLNKKGSLLRLSSHNPHRQKSSRRNATVLHIMLRQSSFKNTSIRLGRLNSYRKGKKASGRLDRCWWKINNLHLWCHIK